MPLGSYVAEENDPNNRKVNNSDATLCWPSGLDSATRKEHFGLCLLEKRGWDVIIFFQSGKKKKSEAFGGGSRKALVAMNTDSYTDQDQGCL